MVHIIAGVHFTCRYLATDFESAALQLPNYGWDDFTDTIMTTLIKNVRTSAAGGKLLVGDELERSTAYRCRGQRQEMYTKFLLVNAPLG
jgi:hypothetical protein